MAAVDASLPVPTRMIDAPSGQFFTSEQWDVLYALLDGALPGFVPKSKALELSDDFRFVVLPDDEFDLILDETAEKLPEGQTRNDLATFLSTHLVDDEKVRDDVLRTLSKSSSVAQLAGLLGMLNTRLGSIFFTGYWTPIHEQPTKVRHAIVQSWANSRFALFRGLAKVVTSTAIKASCGTSLVNEISGYTEAPHDYKPGEAYPFNFIQLDAGDEPHVLETDVIIIGSGPGGGVCAKNLAEAGHRVLVVDKGYYISPSQLPMAHGPAFDYLYENGAVVVGDGGSVSILAGSTWGGGGTVNWSVCLKTQDFVRKEWAESGLPVFASRRYEECMDRVFNYVGAGTDGIRHNHRNKALLEGSEKLGWKAKPVAQNTSNEEHYCGRCHFGCGLDQKNGPAKTWLPDAAEAGAEVMEGFHATRVTFGEDGVTATGVEGEWRSRGPGGDVGSPESERVHRKVQIKAKKVIVSCGSISSPLVLKASGIENPQVGRNLHLHPAHFVTGEWEERTEGWEGGIITSANTEFENLDGNGHGVKLEPTCMIPYICLTQYPWYSGVEAKLLFAKYSRLGSFVSITRDRDTGVVFPDPRTGKHRIKYEVSEHDREHALEGIKALCKICYVTGATVIQPYVDSVKPFKVDKATATSFLAKAATGEVKDPEFFDTRFASWLNDLHTRGSAGPMRPTSSAHQMGSCRMSAKAEDGVVNDKGKVWGHNGLYVADSSVFPSASGVNPMITAMAIADFISRGISDELKG